MPDAQLLKDVRIELTHHELRPVYVVPSQRRTLTAAQGALVLANTGATEDAAWRRRAPPEMH